MGRYANTYRDLFEQFFQCPFRNNIEFLNVKFLMTIPVKGFSFHTCDRFFSFTKKLMNIKSQYVLFSVLQIRIFHLAESKA